MRYGCRGELRGRGRGSRRKEGIEEDEKNT
jgi:hypothetical protein